MNIELSEKEFRRLLDLVYIGNWILNSARGEDRFEDYDLLQEKLFSLCLKNGMPTLATRWMGHVFPSQAYEDGGIHEAIADYEDAVFYSILAEELARIRRVLHGAYAQVAPLAFKRHHEDAVVRGAPDGRPVRNGDRGPRRSVAARGDLH